MRAPRGHGHGQAPGTPQRPPQGGQVPSCPSRWHSYGPPGPQSAGARGRSRSPSPARGPTRGGDLRKLPPLPGSTLARRPCHRRAGSRAASHGGKWNEENVARALPVSKTSPHRLRSLRGKPAHPVTSVLPTDISIKVPGGQTQVLPSGMLVVFCTRPSGAGRSCRALAGVPSSGRSLHPGGSPRAHVRLRQATKTLHPGTPALSWAGQGTHQD